MAQKSYNTPQVSFIERVRAATELKMEQEPSALVMLNSSIVYLRIRTGDPACAREMVHAR